MWWFLFSLAVKFIPPVKELVDFAITAVRALQDKEITDYEKAELLKEWDEFIESVQKVTGGK